MAIALTAITGTAQTGLTSPTYTVTADTPVGPNAKQWAVTALGGTQTGVIPHSISNPFTIAFVRPLVYKLVALVNSATGRLRSSSKNVTKVITRKGVIPLAGQPAEIMIMETTIKIPAGAETADTNSVLACESAHLGAVAQQSSGIGDTTVTGIL